MAVVNGAVYVATSALLGSVGQNQVLQWQNPYNPSQGPTAYLIPPTNNSLIKRIAPNPIAPILYIGVPIGTNGVPHATATVWALDLSTGVGSTIANATDLGFNPTVTGSNPCLCTDGTNLYGTLPLSGGNSSLFSLTCGSGSLVGTVTLPGTPLGRTTGSCTGIAVVGNGNLVFWGPRWIGICTTALGSVTIADVPTIGATGITVGVTLSIGGGFYWVGMRDGGAAQPYLVQAALDLSSVSVVPLPLDVGALSMIWDGASSWGMDQIAGSHVMRFDAAGNTIGRDDRFGPLSLTGNPSLDAVYGGFGVLGPPGAPNAIVATATSLTNQTRVGVIPLGDQSEKPPTIGRVMAAR